MGIGIDNNDIQGSAWGVAFRNKPIMLKTHAEVAAFLDGKIIKNVVLNEDTLTLSTNNSYRNHTTYEVANSGKGSFSLDLGFLIRDETSSLRGNLSDNNDVDFYSFTIPFNRTLQNWFGVEIYMDLPAGCNYSLTLYDEYGNQVGKAEWDGDGRKTLSIPNWDTKTKKYCIKIENESGEEVSPDDYYKIGFHITDNKEHEKTDAINEAYCNLQRAYSQNKDDWREYLDKYNALLQEAEANYMKEVEQLHRKQYESLPEEKQYKGSRTVDELLQDMADGKALSEAELEYVKIFANLQDFEKAQQKAGLKNDFSKEFTKDLEDRGISAKDIEGMRVKIASDGTVTVEGIEDETIRRQVEKLIDEKYKDRLYRYYIGIADSVGNLSGNVYEYAMEVQEVKRYLKAVTGEDIALENLYLTPDGKIGGLPDKVGNMINNTKNNAKIDRIRDMLKDIIQNIGISGGIGIPDFTSEFQFRNGEFSVADSGFHVDANALDQRMTPHYSGNMYSDMYEYKFKKVL